MGDAEFDLGIMYILGEGVPRNLAMAFHWLNLMDVYHDTRSFTFEDSNHESFAATRDYEAAFEEINNESKSGVGIAQVILGLCYQRGYFVYPDDDAAFDWYEKAANQNSSAGQVKLGDMYNEGISVEEDFRQAVKWYKRAADQNDPYGNERLAIMYFFGHGVPANESTGQQFFAKAQAQNEEPVVDDVRARTR